MANLKITLDDALLRRARRVAFDRDLTLTELIRRRLIEDVQRADTVQRQAAEDLTQLWQTSASIGTVTWTRDDLHER